MRTIRVSFERSEGRRDRRFLRPPLAVIVGESEYFSADWSMGGVRLTGFAGEAELGSLITGGLKVDGGERIEFTAEVVRVDPEMAEIALKFVELPERALDLLDRAVARRFARRG